MKDEATFGRILTSLYDAALDPVRWPGFSAIADDALGVRRTSMLVGDGESNEDARIAFQWTYERGQHRPDIEKLYFGTYYALDERVPRIRFAPVGQLLHNTDLFTDRELKTSPVYEAFKTQECADAVNVRLDGPDGSRIHWFLHDPTDRDGWTSDRLNAIRRLLPHIRQTVTVQLALSRVGTVSATLERLLETSGLGVIEVDRRAQIVAVNDRARHFLRRGDVLFDRNGNLFAHTPSTNTQLQRLLGRALPPSGKLGAGGSMIARRPKGAPPLVLHVIPVDGRTIGPVGWPVAALVLVPDAAKTNDVSAVSRVLRLTRAESQVSVYLARGMTVREVAVATSRKQSTVRSHVKHTFTKLGITRQADLVRIVRNLLDLDSIESTSRNRPKS